MTTMKFISNEKGIALITALLFTLMSLAIIMAILYSVTQNIKRTASQKAYRNSVEASYGGAEIMLNEILPKLFNGTETTTQLATDFGTINMAFPGASAAACMAQKLAGASPWPSCTNGTDMNPKHNADVTFDLTGTANQRYTIYSKIVDTVKGADYLNPGGAPLLGGGVAESGGGSMGIPLQHFVYRIEVTGEKKLNPAEQGNISVLYEY